jgi:hypothetical protein
MDSPFGTLLRELRAAEELLDIIMRRSNRWILQTSTDG